MELGEKIIALRRSKSMTQSELGAKLNVTFQAVSKWERGESYPDFDTLSKMAKIFGVSIGYFEDRDQSDDDIFSGQSVAATVNGDDKKMIGFCKECGKVVYENDEACVSPAVICKACALRRENAKRIAENERLAKERKAAQDAENARRNNLAEKREKRNKGLIFSAVINVILVIICIALAVTDSKNVTDYIIGGVVAVLFGFPFIAQLFWNGIVVDVCLSGGKLVGMPGVIFTLDLDGIIFLVAVKILFAVIKFIIFMLTLCVTVFAAMLISPFTLFPQMSKLSKGVEL